MPEFTLNPNEAGLQLHALTGAEFEDARYGKRDRAGQLLEAAWLLQPALKYFHERSVLERGPDTRVFFIVTRKCNSIAVPGKREAVAMLEIAAQPYTENTVGIKYVSVLEAYRKNGLAMLVYGMLVEYLQAKSLRLYRTRPGAKTPPQFTEAVTRLLDEHRVDWFRHELEASY